MSRKPRQKSLSIPIGASVPSASMERYFKIPDWLFLDKSVGWGAKLVYAVINRFSETYTFPIGGYAFIQDVLDISRAQLFRRLDELELAGFINREKSEKYARRIQIMPRHNTLAQAFYEAEDGAFERWNVFKKSLISETLRKNKESHPCDSTTNVLSHPCDINCLTSETVEEGRPYCIREPIREPLKNENHGCAELSLPSQDQSQNLSTTEALLVTEENPLVPPAAPCEEKYSKSQSTSCYDLQLDEPLAEFVANAYRQSRGAKITKAELKRAADKLESMEAAVGPEEFRTSLWIYLNTANDTLRSGKWPIYYFMKYPPTVAPSPATQSPRPVAPRTSSDATANAPAQSAPSTPAPVDPTRSVDYFVDKWNTVVHNRSVDKIYSDTRRQVEVAITDEEFRDRFEELCEACYRLNCGDTEYKFTWLFLTGSGTINWKGVLRGKFDFAMPKLSPSDRVMRDALREERESE